MTNIKNLVYFLTKFIYFTEYDRKRYVDKTITSDPRIVCS